MLEAKEERVRSRDHDCRLRVNTEWLRKVTKKFALIAIATVRLDCGAEILFFEPTESLKFAEESARSSLLKYYPTPLLLSHSAFRLPREKTVTLRGAKVCSLRRVRLFRSLTMSAQK